MSSRPRPKISLKNLSSTPIVGPDTLLHVDYNWWKEAGRSLEAYLSSRLGEEIQLDHDQLSVDIIDEQTAEVQTLSGFEYTIQAYFDQLPDDFVQRGSLVDSVFCALLANGNLPLTAQQIADTIQRPVDVICKTLGGSQVYQGIRAYNE